MWSAQPYNYTVRNNIGNEFLKLIDKCFPHSHLLRKIINRNVLKVTAGSHNLCKKSQDIGIPPLRIDPATAQVTIPAP